MGKRLLVILGILGAAAMLTARIPLSQVKADHCHPSQGQTPATDAKGPVKSGTPDAGHQRTRANAVLPESRPVRGGGPASSAGPAPASPDAGRGGGPAGAATASLEEIYSRDLPTAILSIGEAVKAIESGDRKTELAELNNAVNVLVTIHAALGAHVKPPNTYSLPGAGGAAARSDGSPQQPSPGAAQANKGWANSRCPIMGSPISPESVNASLTRDYKGQKIAFCCAGCPSAWDKLTDAQKQAKLSALNS